MKLNTLGVLAGLLTVLAGCGPVDGVAVSDDVGAVGESEAALTTYPECCAAIPGSGTTEAFCDSVAWSPGRCNAVNGGTSCSWNTANCPVTCCQPISGSGATWAFCSGVGISAGRCNAVNGGTSCSWTC
ncbi:MULTISPECIES: hypothetical protein [Myxococcus]|uniref:hypothetical protein n=1 Tax=Myxococcus TaxID=32 RepID=UPI0013D48263|nr:MULTISPECIES: hypothetical protein [Myxococcus]NVJ24692.1 hypothetical protein [Myxococcus sp. AM011]